jgi:biopolymer transport protein ExbD
MRTLERETTQDDGKRWLAAALLAVGVLGLAWLPLHDVVATRHDSRQAPVEVRVTGAASVIMDREAVTGSELRARLRQLHTDDPARALVVRAEPGARFARVREVLRDVQQMGFASVALESRGGPE